MYNINSTAIPLSSPAQLKNCHLKQEYFILYYMIVSWQWPISNDCFMAVADK